MRPSRPTGRIDSGFVTEPTSSKSGSYAESATFRAIVATRAPVWHARSESGKNTAPATVVDRDLHVAVW